MNALLAVADGRQQLRPACETADPELFFAHRLATWEIDQAKAICAVCSLKVTCLRDALDRGEEYGIWGGLSEGERRTFKRRTALTQEAA
ncbi:WhiB family transcriptional regulator [Streptomyces sp. NPDC048442]|uniref:WhiB family transcriptional regulator n=1 Tax=Streptomyces sp. NPDC048442 TaxID=3154823 RepID=UPI00344391A9